MHPGRARQSCLAKRRQNYQSHPRRQALPPPRKLASLGLWQRSVLSGCSPSRSSISARPPPEAPEAPLRRFAFTPPQGVDDATSYRTNVAISPNGKHIAFITAGSEGKLWVQDLDQRQPRRSTVPKELTTRSGRPTVVSSGLQPVGNSRRSRFRAAWPFGSASCPAQLFLEEPGAPTAR